MDTNTVVNTMLLAIVRRGEIMSVGTPMKSDHRQIKPHSMRPKYLANIKI